MPNNERTLPLITISSVVNSDDADFKIETHGAMENMDASEIANVSASLIQSLLASIEVDDEDRPSFEEAFMECIAEKVLGGAVTVME